METNTENLITITPRITLNPPVLQDIEITENGEYKADGSADGLGTVTVNVEPDNEEIIVTENGEYTPSEEFDGISKVTVDVQPQINLETLNVDENGTYTPQTGVDGFGEVNVNIPAPVLDDINITENGEYNPVNDGFSKVTVDVPDPVLDDINITENGNYVSEHDGFNNVTVAVPDKPLETKNITENGSYSPSQGIYGFSQVTVDVQPDNEEINIVQNGIYTPSANKDGFSKVNVAVPDKPLEIKNIISNGQYTPSNGYYGFSEVNVNVQPNLEEKTITENGTYTPSSGYYGIGQVNVDVVSQLNIQIITPTDNLSLVFPFSFQWNITNLKSGETPTYYLFIDDKLVYRGTENSVTIQSITTDGQNHSCYVFAKTNTRSGFSSVINFSLLYTFLYGFTIDESNLSPIDAVTYTDDCTNFIPASQRNGVFDIGDWSSFVDLICRPVMLNFDGSIAYELSHTNLLYKIDNNTASDINNTSSQMNAFVEFKKIYMKITKNEQLLTVKFCDAKLDDDYHAYAFMNADGDECPFMYYSMFPSVTYDNKPRSIYYDSSFSDASSFNLETKYNKYYTKISLSVWNFLQMLHVLISKTRNSQSVFGNGSTSFNWSTSSPETRLSGNIRFSNPNDYLKTFYIQSFWGFPKYVLEGYYKTSSDIYYKKYPPYDNVNRTNYSHQSLSIGYGYINELKLVDDMLIPSGVGSTISSNQGYCDYQYGTSGYLRTGDFDRTEYLGLFNSDLTSSNNEKIRMIYHPPVI